MDSISVATVATSLAAEAATEAGGAEAAVVEGLRSVVAAVVESLGDGGLLGETLTSSEGNNLRGGSDGGGSS